MAGDISGDSFCDVRAVGRLTRGFRFADHFSRRMLRFEEPVHTDFKEIGNALHAEEIGKSFTSFPFGNALVGIPENFGKSCLRHAPRLSQFGYIFRNDASGIHFCSHVRERSFLCEFAYIDSILYNILSTHRRIAVFDSIFGGIYPQCIYFCVTAGM